MNERPGRKGRRGGRNSASMERRSLLQEKMSKEKKHSTDSLLSYVHVHPNRCDMNRYAYYQPITDLIGWWSWNHFPEVVLTLKLNNEIVCPNISSVTMLYLTNN